MLLFSNRPPADFVRRVAILTVLILFLGISTRAVSAITDSITNTDDSGKLTVYSSDTVDGISFGNPFFQPLGTNGRTCNSCHRLESGMSLSVTQVRAVFDQTKGNDPLFRTNDGSDAPTGLYSKISTLPERRVSFSMLLNHGTIRVDLPMPHNADFALTKIQDPYDYATAQHLSLFRRPLPSANLEFIARVMWDGRESPGGESSPMSDLQRQAEDATLGHAQATGPLSSAQKQAIVNFETHLFTAQSASNLAGTLDAAACSGCAAAAGGPINLAQVNFFPGVNDPFGPGYDPVLFHIFKPWQDIPLTDTSQLANNRRAIAAGESIFNTKTFNISGVRGLNDVLGQPVIRGTCGTCHNTPEAGSQSLPRFMDIGAAEVQGNPLFSNDYPVYTLMRNSDHQNIRVTDPGRALITGKFDDLGKFKVPSLRGLAARAPYFHNGQADTLEDVVNFYDLRFNIRLAPQELDDLVLFLEQL